MIEFIVSVFIGGLLGIILMGALCMARDNGGQFFDDNNQGQG